MLSTEFMELLIRWEYLNTCPFHTHSHFAPIVVWAKSIPLHF